MATVDIEIKNDQSNFYAGDTVSGIAKVSLPVDVPLENVSLSFRCLGEVNWVEYHGTPRHMDSCIFYDQAEYHEEQLQIGLQTISVLDEAEAKQYSIPFSFVIPADKHLPSSMISQHGFVKYFVQVAIKLPGSEEVKKFIKEQIVLSPIDRNLMITVGGTAEKSVLLHNGHVSMHASIGRKGFALGEPVTVHVNVDNKTNTSVVPRLTLHQVQIYMTGLGHKTVETILTEQPILGQEVAAHSAAEELLTLTMPSTESLSIKSTLITVKYFIHVTLNIPHSFDLHVNLPVVLTTKKAIQLLRNKAEEQPEIVNASL